MNLIMLILSYDAAVFVLIAFVAVYVYATRNFGYWRKRNVKEIAAWPFFGNFAQCLLMQSPVEGFVRKLYEAGKCERLVGYYILDEPQLMVRDPELIRYILIKDFQNFPDRQVMASDNDEFGRANLFIVKEPLWRIKRHILSKFFTSGTMKKVFGRMPEIAADFDKLLMSIGVRDNKVVDISDVCNKFATDLIGVTTYGIKLNTLNNVRAEFDEHRRYMIRPTYRRHFECLSTFFMRRFLKPLDIKFFTDRSANFFNAVFTEALHEKKKYKAAKADFFDFMNNLKDDSVASQNIYDFDDKDIVAQATVYFTAGTGTILITMMFTLYELAKNIDVQKKLRKEIQEAMMENDGKLTYEMVTTLPYLDAAIAESLRIYPTVPFLDRVAVNKYTFPNTNVTIDKGTVISIPVRALQMDPKFYPDPERYQPERFYGENKGSINKYTYLPFGDGPRMCIGKRLGLMVAKFAISHIISKYEVNLCSETKIPMEFSIVSILLNSKDPIKLNMKAIC